MNSGGQQVSITPTSQQVVILLFIGTSCKIECVIGWVTITILLLKTHYT